MTNNKNNIVIVMPTLSSGGAERVISIICNNWIKKGYKINLILWNIENQFYTINENVNIIDLNFRYKNKIERFYKQLKVIYLLRKHLKNIKPKFILSFLPLNNIVTLISSLFLKIDVIVSERNNPKELNIDLSSKLFFLRKFLYKNFAKGIISQTLLAKKLISKEFPNIRVTAIPNPIKNLDIKRNHIERNLLLNIGRLHPQKGQLDLIDIVSQLKTKDFKLVILGEGTLREELENKIKLLKLENKVLLKGAVNNIDEWFEKASIFLFSSKNEGFPNALAEAMISGIPSISYDCETGPNELIDNNLNGFLIKLNDKENFTKKIDLLLEEEELRNKFATESKKLAFKLNEELITNKYLDFCLECTK
jgi:GalNAc-alpha-(1->4)-GalNAc-alpha-(1->3)-diNAcBac-PP-undecaprenol alpha-1,4-N-acetyl-D-galactosaminyltransferase